MRTTPANQPVRKAGTSLRVARAATLAIAAMACAEPAWAELPTSSPTTTTATTTPSVPSVPSTPSEVETRLVEWDISSLGDVTPGSLAVDDRSSKHSKVWFVTRALEPRLYRFTPGVDMKKHQASATSWPLGAELTGGVRTRHSDDGRFAFVNVNQVAPGTGAVVAVDTKDNTRISWRDRPVFPYISDVSVDTRDGGTTVFTAAPYYDQNEFNFGGAAEGVVQRLRPGKPQYMNGQWVVPAVVTRYPVGGGAGTCDEASVSVTSPCIPGVTVDRRRGHPIYVSEPHYLANLDGTFRSAVAEIDPRPTKCPDGSYKCVAVRHWPLPVDLGSPRQIRVDDVGRIWGVTDLGNLFSLEIERSSDRAKLTRHNPLGFDEYLFAVAPDAGVVGFTDSNNHKVSVLLPERRTETIYPKRDVIKPVERTIFGQLVRVETKWHSVSPSTAQAMGTKYRNEGDGTYVETNVSSGIVRSNASGPSIAPTGMEADGKWKNGAFFYGVASNGSEGLTNRIGHLAVRLQHDKDAECRRGDHDVDHDGKDDEEDDDIDGDNVPNEFDDDDDNDNVLDLVDDDKNDDGIEDGYQSPGHREHKRNDKGRMEAGESREYEMTYDGPSVAMVAVVEAAELTAPLSIEVVNDDGVVLFRTPPAVGKAVATVVPSLPGVYTIRVKNGSTQPVNYKTTLIGKQIRLPL